MIQFYKRFFIICFLTVYNLNAQSVGINTNTPSATLDINASLKPSTADGLIIPNLDRLTAQNSVNTEEGTLIYINDISTGTLSNKTAYVFNTGYYYFNGTHWRNINPKVGFAKFYKNNQQNHTGGFPFDFIVNTIKFNNVPSHISVNTATGEITLKPGIYQLNGTIGAIGKDNGVNNGNLKSEFVFYNVTTGQTIGHGGSSEGGPAQNIYAKPYNTANTVLHVTSDTVVKLIVTRLDTADEISNDGDFFEDDLGRGWITVQKYE